AEAVIDRGHPRAAVFLGQLDAHHSQLGELRDQLGRKMLRVVPFAHVRPDFGLGELADGLAKELLVVCKAEVHAWPGEKIISLGPWTLGGPGRCARTDANIAARWPRARADWR